jgi:cell division protein FtsB
MSFVQGAKRAALAALPPAVFLALTGYFCWNATRGEHGLTAYRLGEKQLVAAQSELKSAETERNAWENRVAGLRANHIDPDTLDERSRAMLNLADPSDIVVPYGQKSKLF